MSEAQLEYSEVIDFAIQNIPRIQSASEIKEHWGHKIIDITESRHDLIRDNPMTFISATHRFIGQENFFFSFHAGKRLVGEFSIDFLPVNANEYLREQMRSMAERSESQNFSNMRAFSPP